MLKLIMRGSLGNFTIVGGGVTVQRSVAAGVDNFRIFNVAPQKTVDISNMVITNGSVPDGFGGGIWNRGILNLYYVTLWGNFAESGGAITNGDGAVLTVQNCSIFSNQATMTGGAIVNAGTAFIQFGTVIEENMAGRQGGGIRNFEGAILTIDTGSQISANTAQWGGGGIYNQGNLAMQDAFLNDNVACLVQGVVQAGGGGLSNTGTANLTNVSIQGNTAWDDVNGQGGGILVRLGTVTLVSGCTVAGNTAGRLNGGNGIYKQVNGTLNDNPTSNDITDNVVNG